MFSLDKSRLENSENHPVRIGEKEREQFLKAIKDTMDMFDVFPERDENSLLTVYKKALSIKFRPI